ncbi:trypsin domain-containing protein [Phthorimaea operculella]|nr:trypsin domain-containing protein [Phthorimaea operculella]
MKFFFYILGTFLQLLWGVRAIEVATTVPAEVADKIPNVLKNNDTRRIINGELVTDNRPYMVHLKLPSTNDRQRHYKKWLCGGVIVHEEYIMTSAACIEDVEHFYVVSGTYKYADDDDRYNNPCIKNGAKKAIWKCVPKNYVFDGHENDNIRWMNNDIAIVKVEEGFDFTRRVRGCSFIPKPVCYNNQSLTLENAGNVASVAGWGTTEKYNEWVNRRSDGRRYQENQETLLEAAVEIISKQRCKNRWGSRYHNIIDNYMICTKDIGQTMSEICSEKYVECQDINYYDGDEDEGRRQMKTDKVPVNLMVHSAYHNETMLLNGTRRQRPTNHHNQIDGGFCENDHGGPLVHGSGVSSIVIGVISACLVKERSNKCYGPFLYTSVYKNRQFISCSLYKDVEPKCRRQFRSGVTHEEKTISWKNHPDGPAKSETDKKPVQAQPGLPSAGADAADTVLEPLQPPESAPAAAPVPVPPAAPVTPPATVATPAPDKVYPNDGFVMRSDIANGTAAT